MTSPLTYRTISCIGTASFRDGYGVTLPFFIECKANGEIEIRTSGSDSSVNSELHRRLRQKCQFRGTTSEGAAINSSTMQLFGESDSYRSGQFSFSFRFFLIGKMRINYQRLPSGGMVELKVGLINLLFYQLRLYVRLEKMIVFELVDHFINLDKSLSAEGFQLTAVAKILTHPSGITESKNVIDDLVNLLSFATGTYVSPAYLDVYRIDGTRIYSEIQPVRTHKYRDTPLIDCRFNTSDLVRFLEKSYPSYRNLVGKLKLNVALDNCNMSELSPTLDIRFIVTFIGLESLLQRLQNHLPYKAQRHRFVRALLINLHLAKKESLVLSRLRRALAYYNLTDRAGVSKDIQSGGRPNYEQIRNRLVHSGTWPKNVEPLQSYVSLLNLYERLLLAILDYRDYFIDKSMDYKRRIVD